MDASAKEKYVATHTVVAGPISNSEQKMHELTSLARKVHEYISLKLDEGGNVDVTVDFANIPTDKVEINGKVFNVSEMREKPQLIKINPGEPIEIKWREHDGKHNELVVELQTQMPNALEQRAPDKMAPSYAAQQPKSSELLEQLTGLQCDKGTLTLIYTYLEGEHLSESQENTKLSQIVSFAKSIGSDAARWYFRAIGDTKAVAELTDERVFEASEFAKSLGSDAAYGYFWAIGNTKAVAELTDERILTFAKSLGSAAAYWYFQAIGNTKAVTELTGERVLTFAKSLGSETASTYFWAIGGTKAVTELTDKRVLAFAKSLGSDVARWYFKAISNTEAVAELTDKRVLRASEFVKSIGSDAAYGYFKTIGGTKAVTELTDKRVLTFAKSLGSDAACEYFRAIGDTKAVTELTDKRIFGASEFVKSIGSDAAYGYFRAIGNTEAVAELTDERILTFAKSLGDDVASTYFRAIGNTKAVAELTDERVFEASEFLKSIDSDAAYGYFQAIGNTKAVAELTDKRIFGASEFVKSIDSTAAYWYFQAIGDTKAVAELTENSFLTWLKDSYEIDGLPELLPNLGAVLNYSSSHLLYKNPPSFSNDPIIKLLKPEHAEDNPGMFKTEVMGWVELIKVLNEAEKKGFGAVDSAAFGRMVALFQRTGGSVVYLAFASDFLDSEEKLKILFSGERGRIDAMMIGGVNAYFKNLSGLPNSIEGWGGIEILRLTWENKEHFIGNETLLTGLLPKLFDQERAYINSKLPNFNAQYSAIYNLLSENMKAKELEKKDFDRIVSDCNEMAKALFTQPKNEIVIKDQFATLSNSVGKGLKGRLGYLWNKYRPDENADYLRLRDFARALREMEKDMKSLEKQNPDRYAEAIYAHGQILNAAEIIFAKRYYDEKLAGKTAHDMFSAQEILSTIYQYIIDPDFHGVASPGRRMLFDICATTISTDSHILGEAIPNTGILSVKGWERSLSDVFGGRYSGDCTAPPNTGEYSGINFDKNFGWINDPGTYILNVYWQKDPKEKQVPVGRIYCFAALLDGKPAVFIDSLEFLASFPVGPEVMKALPLLVEDYTKHLGTTVAIDAEGKISNRPWVKPAIDVGFEKKIVQAQKLGNPVYTENIRTEQEEVRVFIIE